MKTKLHWLVLIAMCGLSASSVGLLINSVGVFYSPVSDSLGILRGTFALHVTLSTFVCAITSLFVSKILNEKNFKMIVTIGIITASMSTILMSCSTQMWQYLILGIIRGIGNAFFGMVIITILVNNWFIKFHGLATSVALSFGGISGAICSPFLTNIIEKYGWNIAFIVMGIMIFVFCIPFLVLPISIKPEQKGIKPYGFKIEQDNDNSIQYNSNKTFKYLSNPFISLFIFCLLLTSITSFTQHFPGFAQSIKVSAQVGSFMISACMFGNIISKLLIGILSDIMGPIKSIILMMCINVIACIVLVNTTSVNLLLIAAFMFGFIYSISAVGIVLLTKLAFGVEHYDKAYPVISFAGNVGSACTISLIGYLYDFTGTYKIAFLFILIFEIINLFLLYCINKKAMNMI